MKKQVVTISCPDCSGTGVFYSPQAAEATGGKVPVCHVCQGWGFKKIELHPYARELEIIAGVMTVILGDKREVSYEEFLSLHKTPIR